jgi:hypothetical protein
MCLNPIARGVWTLGRALPIPDAHVFREVFLRAKLVPAAWRTAGPIKQVPFCEFDCLTMPSGVTREARKYQVVPITERLAEVLMAPSKSVSTNAAAIACVKRSANLCES